MAAGSAATAAYLGGRPEVPRIQLLDFLPIIRRFCRLQVPSALIIRDVAVSVGRNGPRTNLPAKCRISQDGGQKTDVGRRPAYVPTLEWRDSAVADRFGKAAIALLRSTQPGDLAD
jgi:hypothetical protein